MVNTGLLEVVFLLDEGRDVLLGASGREGTRYSDDDDLLVLELFMKLSLLVL